MEEQKNSKEVKMNVVANPNQEVENPEGSLIEELKKWPKDKLIDQIITMNRQLYNQDNYANQLKKRIVEMQEFISNKRMDLLMQVVNIASQNKETSSYACFAKDFVEDCIKEIQESLTIPEQTEEPKEEK